MTEPLIFSVGTQVLVQKDTYHANHRKAHPAGSVGAIVRSPIDRTPVYRVKFNDGFEAAVHHDQLVRLSAFNPVNCLSKLSFEFLYQTRSVPLKTIETLYGMTMSQLTQTSRFL